MFKCNNDEGGKHEYEEHCRDSNGVELNKLARETVIKVDSRSSLNLPPCLDIESQAEDKVTQVLAIIGKLF